MMRLSRRAALRILGTGGGLLGAGLAGRHALHGRRSTTHGPAPAAPAMMAGITGNQGMMG
jgi:hypothetical protein